jgi:hypothetical protein
VNGIKVRSTGNNDALLQEMFFRDFGIKDYPESGVYLPKTIFREIPYEFWWSLTENGKKQSVDLDIELRVIKKRGDVKRVLSVHKVPVKMRLIYNENLVNSHIANELYLDEVIE